MQCMCPIMTLCYDLCCDLCFDLVGALDGWWVMWLWRAAYASECASTRTKVLLVTDWMKAFVFGRDSSRI